jgi:hypothetical protein
VVFGALFINSLRTKARVGFPVWKRDVLGIWRGGVYLPDLFFSKQVYFFNHRLKEKKGEKKGVD